MFGLGGPTVEEKGSEEEVARYWDENTGVELDPSPVEEARRTEVEYMHKLGVYREAQWSEMEDIGLKPVPTRWLEVNKGDAERVNIRSRIVAQEARGRTDLGKKDIASTFAATPPLEAVKMLCSLAMTGQGHVQEDDRRVLGFYDISRAHFHSPARRNIFVTPPKEDKSIRTGLAKLCKSMYGCKDAAQCFDAFAEASMAAIGFKSGRYNPCIYLCEEKARRLR